MCKEDSHPLIKHADGKYYCIFHLPTNEKPAERFEHLFRTKLSEIEAKIIRAESELPAKEIDKAKREIRYDFRGVWFPSDIRLARYQFNAAVDFSFATFASLADFEGAKFALRATFIDTRFHSYANFGGTTLCSSATFAHARFVSAGFALANFSAYAGFTSAIFLTNAVFAFAKFASNTEFTSAIFAEKSRG